VTACAFRADARKIGLAGVEDKPSGLCDSTDLLPSLSGAVLRPSAPRQRVPSLRARHRSDAELRAGHRRKTPADRLHLGSIFDSCRGRRREARCRAASDLRLHPPLARSKLVAFVPRVPALPQGYLVSEPRGPRLTKGCRVPPAGKGWRPLGVLGSTFASRGRASRSAASRARRRGVAVRPDSV
jgi:hypothetical protein